MNSKFSVQHFTACDFVLLSNGAVTELSLQFLQLESWSLDTWRVEI